MRKKILFTSTLIFSFFIIFILYLSIYGIKTNSFNDFINNKVKKYNSNLILKIDDVFIKLNIFKSAININTKNAVLIDQSNRLKINNLNINLNLINFLKNENSIKSVKIISSENSISDVTSVLNTIDYDFSRYIIYSQIKKGSLNFELDVNFKKTSSDILSYSISGSVSNAILNILGHENINDINFDFQSQNRKTKILNLNFNHQNLNFSSKSIDINREKSNEYYIKGDLQNNKTSINPNLIFNKIIYLIKILYLKVKIFSLLD